MTMNIKVEMPSLEDQREWGKRIRGLDSTPAVAQARVNPMLVKALNEKAVPIMDAPDPEGDRVLRRHAKRFVTSGV